MSNDLKINILAEIFCNTILLVLDALVFYCVKMMVDTEIHSSQMLQIAIIFTIVYFTFAWLYKNTHSKRVAILTKIEKLKMFDAISKLNAHSFYGNPNEEYTSMIQNDVETIREEYYESGIQFIGLLIKLAVYILIVGYIDVRFVVFVLGMSILGFVFRNVGDIDLEGVILNRKEKREKYEHIVKNIYDCRTTINTNTVDNIETFYLKYLDDLSDSKVKFGKRKSLLILLTNSKLTILNCLTVVVLVCMYNYNITTLGSAILLYKYIDELMYIMLDMNTCWGLIQGTKELRKKVLFEDKSFSSVFEEPIESVQLKNVTVDYLDISYNYKFKIGYTYFLEGNIGTGKSTLFRILKNQISFIGDYLVNDRIVDVNTNLDDEVILMSQIVPMLNVSFKELTEDYFSISLDEVTKFVSQHNLDDFESIMNCDNCSLLSSGERQKLCIVLLVLSNYSVKLYDEPTANIDIEHKQKYLNLIVADTDAMNLVIAHDMKKEMMEVLEIIIL